MTIKHIETLILNEPSKSGRIYTTEVVSDALSKLKFPIYGAFGHVETLNVPLDRVGFSVTNAYIDNNFLCIDIEVLEKTPCGFILNELLTENVELTYYPVMTGIVSADNHVNDLDIVMWTVDNVE
ncbi:MAG: hypothetical protein WC284_12940 [Candidimonas sp.]